MHRFCLAKSLRESTTPPAIDGIKLSGFREPAQPLRKYKQRNRFQPRNLDAREEPT